MMLRLWRLLDSIYDGTKDVTVYAEPDVVIHTKSDRSVMVDALDKYRNRLVFDFRIMPSEIIIFLEYIG